MTQGDPDPGGKKVAKRTGSKQLLIHATTSMEFSLNRRFS